VLLKPIAKYACLNSGCPTVFETDRGSYVIQGYEVAESQTHGAAPVPAGEARVEIPTSLIDDLIAIHTQG
jgi:hypothetical protein